MPLHYAADGGNIEALRALVTEFNCPPDYMDDVDPSFYQAVRLLTTSAYTLWRASINCRQTFCVDGQVRGVPIAIAVSWCDVNIVLCIWS